MDGKSVREKGGRREWKGKVGKGVEEKKLAVRCSEGQVRLRSDIQYLDISTTSAFVEGMDGGCNNPGNDWLLVAWVLRKRTLNKEAVIERLLSKPTQGIL